VPDGRGSIHKRSPNKGRRPANSLKADQPLDDYRTVVERAALFIARAIENGMDPDIVAPSRTGSNRSEASETALSREIGRSAAEPSAANQTPYGYPDRSTHQ
jgi:hypothetical protein